MAPTLRTRIVSGSATIGPESENPVAAPLSIGPTMPIPIALGASRLNRITMSRSSVVPYVLSVPAMQKATLLKETRASGASIRNGAAWSATATVVPIPSIRVTRSSAVRTAPSVPVE